MQGRTKGPAGRWVGTSLSWGSPTSGSRGTEPWNAGPCRDCSDKPGSSAAEAGAARGHSGSDATPGRTSSPRLDREPTLKRQTGTGGCVGNGSRVAGKPPRASRREGPAKPDQKMSDKERRGQDTGTSRALTLPLDLRPSRWQQGRRAGDDAVPATGCTGCDWEWRRKTAVGARERIPHAAKTRCSSWASCGDSV